MERFYQMLLKRRKQVIAGFALVTLVTALMIPFVSINYDLTAYLPQQTLGSRSIAMLEQEFGYTGSSQLMAEQISVAEAMQLKQQLEQIDGVSSVLWLDDVCDITQPIQYIDKSVSELYYADGCALYTLNFDEDDYSLRTGAALKEARELAAAYDPAIFGPAEQSLTVRGVLADEMINIMLVIVPICLLILTLISSSWVEPLLYILVIVAAVIINMGTGVFFGQVSFITFAMTAAIQLAVSIDYSLFLTHRFEEEKARGLPLDEAINIAARKSWPAVAASALTTVAGFSAMAFMDYTIGRDIGLVLARGVVFSFISVVLFLPPLIKSLYPLIEKTRHRSFFVFPQSLARRIVRGRYLFLLLALAAIIPAYFGQLNTEFLYGDSSGASSDGVIAEQKQRIEERFGVSAQCVLMFPSGDIAAEQQLADTLTANPYIDSVQGLVTLADPSIPREFLPAYLLDSFQSERYGRMILNILTVDENQYMYDTVEYIKDSAAAFYGDDYYLAGNAVSINDIRLSVNADYRTVSYFSMLAVALIILLTFRSLLMPVLLVMVIQGAVFINMCIPYYLDQPLVFIGYLVVSSLQLGATIDYAILMANRYMEQRRSLPPLGSAIAALHRSGLSVLTSGLILATAGFCEYLLSELEAIQDIGLLIGRGALLSMLLVLLALPAVLMIFDRPLRHTTFRARFYTPAKQEESHE
ncbi:MAG: MMPL family transporter [Bacillota bacterium]|nr:MMPL family transporter [Bacillota bacterium]